METFDYIIAGAGSAGCVLANRLSADPRRRVLLLEAGGRDISPLIAMPAGMSEIVPPGKSRCNWEYWTAPQVHLGGRRLYWPRGKTLGGTSSINGMVYIRGHSSDYDGWRQLGCAGWGWDDVLPYFLKSEDSERGAGPFHGAGGPLRTSRQSSPNILIDAFVAASAECGLAVNDDFNGVSMEGAGRYDSTTWKGERWSAARAYLRPVLHRKNLKVVTGALVERVVIKEGRAGGVEARTKKGLETFTAAAEVILCGGAVNTPQLLMLSGIGPAAHLQALGIPVIADRGEVGGNLQDHLDLTLQWNCRKPVSLNGGLTLPGRLWSAILWAASRKGPGAHIVTPAGAFIRSRPGLEAPDLQLHFMCAWGPPHGAGGLPTSHGYQLHVCQLRPESRGTIRLASPDPADHPHIDPDYLSAAEDVETMLNGIAIARRIGNAPAFAPFGPSERLPGPAIRDREAMLGVLRGHAETIYHPVGTARMGSDPEAVTDPSLRVRGVEGLRIADASVMPRLISGNTNAPVIMIAEKAADMILSAAAGRG